MTRSIKVRYWLGNSRGIALIAVLWTVMLLTLLAQGFLADATTTVNLTRNMVERAKAKALADGAIHIAIKSLLDRSKTANGLDTLPPMTLAIDGAKITITIEDEGGKIDLNHASNALLIALFQSAGVDRDKAVALTDAIADWRDSDHNRRLNGAEDRDYRGGGLAYGAKDRAFEAVDELRMVLGMTRELYDRVAPALTVHSRQRGVDLRYAPAGVLHVLVKDDPDGVEALLSARKVGAPSDLNAALRRFGAQRRFLTRSRHTAYTIRARVETASGTVFIRRAIVRLRKQRGAAYAVLDWK